GLPRFMRPWPGWARRLASVIGLSTGTVPLVPWMEIQQQPCVRQKREGPTARWNCGAISIKMRAMFKITMMTRKERRAYFLRVFPTYLLTGELESQLVWQRTCHRIIWEKQSMPYLR